jgi:hypothetical protein
MPPGSSTHRRVAASAILAAAFLTPALTAAPAQAQNCKKGNPFSCHLVDGGSSTGGRGGPSGGGASGPVEPPDPEGLTDGEAPGFIQVPGGPPQPAALTTLDWAQAAKSSADLDTPTVKTAPAGKTYVRVRTSLWVEGVSVKNTTPIRLAGQTIWATATPVSVTWRLGETEHTCNDLGSKDGKTCNYTYKRSSAREPGGVYMVSASVTWEFTWTCEGAACDANEGNLGTVTGIPDEVPLVVSEIQTNTGQ